MTAFPGRENDDMAFLREMADAVGPMSPAEQALQEGYKDLCQQNRWLMDTFDPALGTAQDLLGYLHREVYGDIVAEAPQYADMLQDKMWDDLGLKYEPLPPDLLPGEIDTVKPDTGGTQIRYLLRADGIMLPVRILVKKDGNGGMYQIVELMSYDSAKEMHGRVSRSAATAAKPFVNEPAVKAELSPEDLRRVEEVSAPLSVEQARRELVEKMLPDLLDMRRGARVVGEATKEYAATLGKVLLTEISDVCMLDEFDQTEQATRRADLDRRVTLRRVELYIMNAILAGSATVLGWAAGEGIAEAAERARYAAWKVLSMKVGLMSVGASTMAIAVTRNWKTRSLQKFRTLQSDSASTLDDRLKQEQALADEYDRGLKPFSRRRRG